MIRSIDAQTFRTALEVQTCIASVLALELMRPGGTLYICAPEIVDSPILDNSLLEFSALLPHLPTPQIRLGTILQSLSERGVSIRLIVPPPAPRGTPLAPPAWWWAEVRHSAPLLEQGLFTDTACLHGDLRFTQAGVTAWAGTLDLLTDADAILPRLNAQRRWEQLA